MVRTEFQSARLAANKTQRELGNDCNVTENYIRQVENGRRDPSGKIMLRIAKVLERPPELLFNDLLDNCD